MECQLMITSTNTLTHMWFMQTFVFNQSPLVLCQTWNKIEQLCRKTLLLDKVAEATVNFPSANNRQTNTASSGTDDDIIISSALLIASTLSYSNTNQQLTRKQTIDQSQLGGRDRNCRRIDMVSIYWTHQKLCNLWCQTGNFVEQHSYTTSCSTLSCVWHGPYLHS